MSRLRLPRFAAFAPSASPPVAPTPAAAVRVLLGRREFLKALGALSVLLLAPWTRVERAWAGRRGRFFTRDERRTLEALVDTILPPDDTPGAADLGVVRYVEGLLAAADRRRPHLYAGGPYSGRNPFIDYDDGTPAHHRPRNAFKHFVPPTRLQALYWRWQLLGSAGLDADEQALVAPLDAQLGGPLTGLREVYRSGLGALDALARMQEGAPFLELDADARARVRNTARALPPDPRRGQNFIGIVVQHTLEGAFAAPEYGGNRNGAGWALVGIEGDSQPLGYALYSRADDAVHERPEHPLSTPNPDEVDAPRPLSPTGEQIETFVVAVTDGLPDTCGGTPA